MATDLNQLKAYIEEARQRGFPDQQIIDHLLKNQIPREDINKVLAQDLVKLSSFNQPQTYQSKKIPQIIFISLIIIFILFIAFLTLRFILQNLYEDTNNQISLEQTKIKRTKASFLHPISDNTLSYMLEFITANQTTFEQDYKNTFTAANYYQKDDLLILEFVRFENRSAQQVPLLTLKDSTFTISKDQLPLCQKPFDQIIIKNDTLYFPYSLQDYPQAPNMLIQRFFFGPKQSCQIELQNPPYKLQVEFSDGYIYPRNLTQIF